METDSEIDGDLARILSCMGTNDKEALVRQFQQVLGDHSLTPEACHFFLDMSNWNLQNALGHYYDYGVAHNVASVLESAALNMQLVSDVTIGEGEAVPPNTRFVKTWRVRNNGLIPWPPGTSIRFVEGTRLSDSIQYSVQPIQPNEEVDISIEMISPNESGMFQGRWHLSTFQCVPFGESIWCILTVDKNGILDITQQLANVPTGHQHHHTQSVDMATSYYSPQPHNIFGPSDRPVLNPFQMNAAAVLGGSDTSMDEDDRPLKPPMSAPVQIQQEQVEPAVPPCTPCTPPNDQAQ